MMYKKINQLMMKFLDELFYNQTTDEKLLNEIIEKNIVLDKSGKGNPALDSAENIDFITFRKCIYQLVMEEKTYEDIQFSYHSYKKMMVVDSISDSGHTIDIINSSPELFCRDKINNEDLKKELVYLDYNIIIACEENSDIRKKILEKKEVQFYYSPAHTEEIFKRKKIENHKDILDLLGKITNNVGIFNVEGNELAFYKENPNFPYIRTAVCGKELNENVEYYRLLINEDKTISQPMYKEQKHTSFINSRDLLLDKEARNMFDFALRKYGMNMGIDDFEELDSNKDLTQNYTYLNSYIYSIMNALMFLSYKADKNEKTIRSGLYDVEHLIYGSKCNTFVTDDRKFAERAKIVYKLLKLDINVVLKKDYFELKN